MEKLKQAIEEAECVLIGIGNEFRNIDIDHNLLKIYNEKLKNTEEKYEWLLPFMRSQGNQEAQRYLKAYQEIYQMVKEKNYFVVTLNEDDLIYQSPFEPQKITAPCGSYQRLQCSNGCKESLVPADEIVSGIIEMLKDPDVSLSQIHSPVCKECGANLVFNVVGQENYLEEGYMETWKRYRMWLTGTLNRKLCLLELGVDFKYPSIIRWAFEKVAFLNDKAVMFRINEKYPQLTEEIKKKAYSYEKNAVDFFSNDADAHQK